MKEFKHRTLDDFYREIAEVTGKDIETFLRPNFNKDIGHFNVFDIADTIKQLNKTSVMPYNRRAYYKISLIRGKCKAEYADKVIEIENSALLFATPKVPYHWIPQTPDMSGSFCVFTSEFLNKNKSLGSADDLPIFQPGSYPVFPISEKDTDEISLIFNKMKNEISSDYQYKYDLIHNYVLELIHYGQKLQPTMTPSTELNASIRITSLFVELLERQFPIESPHQRLMLRTAKDYADRLTIHVNYLNKVLKENTGKTTTDIIISRIILEAKILLKQTDWNISEIAYSLGFEEVAHFSNFFKKQASVSPLSFRS